MQSDLRSELVTEKIVSRGKLSMDLAFALFTTLLLWQTASGAILSSGSSKVVALDLVGHVLVFMFGIEHSVNSKAIYTLNTSLIHPSFSCHRLILNFIHVLHECSTTLTSSLLLRHLLSTMFDISTKRYLDRLAFTRELVDTVASVFDKEVVDFFECEVAGFWVAIWVVRTEEVRWKDKVGRWEKKEGGAREGEVKGDIEGAGNVPEIYQRHKGKVCAHEDEVGLPLKLVEEGWSDHHNDKVLYCC